MEAENLNQNNNFTAENPNFTGNYKKNFNQRGRGGFRGRGRGFKNVLLLLIKKRIFTKIKIIIKIKKETKLINTKTITISKYF